MLSSDKVGEIEKVGCYSIRKGGKGGTIVFKKSFEVRCKSTNGKSWIQDNEPISIGKINNGGAWP